MDKTSKGSTTIEPGEHDLSTKLPVEIWSKIFSHIQEIPSLLACSNTCSYWHAILLEERPSILFAIVLPTLSKYLDNSTFLKCRLVSKRWKHSVDRFRQEFEARWEPNFHLDSSPFMMVYNETGIHGWKNKFSSRQQCQQFLETMKYHKGNPFPTKTVLYISSGDWEEQDCFIKILQQFGEHVCRFIFTVQVALDIPRMLELMKNLKRCDILQMDRRNRTELQLILEPLPELPHLNYLTVFSFNTSPSILPRFLDKYGHQLDSLECGSHDICQLSHSYRVLYQVTSLKVWPSENRNREVATSLSLRKFSLLRRVSMPSVNFLCNSDSVELQLYLQVLAELEHVEEIHIPQEVEALTSDFNWRKSFETHLSMQFSSLRILQVSYSMMMSPFLEKILKKCASTLRILYFGDCSYVGKRSSDWRQVSANYEEECKDFGVSAKESKYLQRILQICPKLEKVCVMYRFVDRTKCRLIFQNSGTGTNSCDTSIVGKSIISKVKALFRVL